MSLLSRISNGGESFGSHEIETSLEFKTVFATFLSSPVINVRRLAAKAFANFTDRLAFSKNIYWGSKVWTHLDFKWSIIGSVFSDCIFLDYLYILLTCSFITILK